MLIPMAIMLAACSLIWTCIMFVVVPAFLFLMLRQFGKEPKCVFLPPPNVETHMLSYITKNTVLSCFYSQKFFLSWNMWSVLFLWMLFESTVPLLEVLPEENFIMIIFMTISVLSFYKVKERAPLNFVLDGPVPKHRHNSDSETKLLIETCDDDGDDDDDKPELLGKDEASSSSSSDSPTDDGHSEAVDLNNPAVCPLCRRYAPPRSVHCAVCNACVVRHDHHNVWLNCCVGQNSHRLYFVGCLFGVLALLMGANLALTSICHPFLLWHVLGTYVLLPDDCSDVYMMYE